MMRINIFVVICFFGVWLAGCATASHYQELLALKRLSDNQKEIEAYVRAQELLFNKLKEDIQGNLLAQGVSKEEILARYGDPIFCKPLPEKGESCFYRHPTRYFNTDSIYLFFDQDEKLHSWDVPSGARL